METTAILLVFLDFSSIQRKRKAEYIVYEWLNDRVVGAHFLSPFGKMNDTWQHAFHHTTVCISPRFCLKECD